MKKAILFTLVASLLLSSCKKDHSGGNNTITPVPKTYKVNFNVSGFTQTITNAATNKLQTNSLKTAAITGIGGNLDQLFYYVFDSQGKLVHFLSQDSTTTKFGNISDSLPAGTYTVVIGAGKKGFNIFTSGPGDTPENDWYFSYTPNYYYSLNKIIAPWEDTFYDKFQITVAGDINQNVSLNRIVGQLQVVVLDAIPAAANSITVSINPEDIAFRFYPTEQLIGQTLTGPPATGVTTLDTSFISSAAKGTTNYTITSLVGNTINPFTVKITMYDASQNIIGSAEADNVTCQKNTRTILSGNLTGSNNGFNITVGGAWNPNPITIPFNSNNAIRKN